jgi:hypothetical protein
MGILIIYLNVPANCNKERKQMMISTDSILRMIGNADFNSWTGLAPGIISADIKKVFTEEREARAYTLSGRKLTQVGYRVPGQVDPVWMWYENDVLVLVRMSGPTLKNSVGSLMEYLGKPEMKIEAEQGFIYPMAAQWVYAKKGITLYVNDFLKNGEGYPDDFIEAVALYQPTTAREYKETLGATETRIRRKYEKDE